MAFFFAPIPCCDMLPFPWVTDLKFVSDREEDSHRLSQRQKQIDFGKNTRGYDIYLQKIPK